MKKIFLISGLIIITAVSAFSQSSQVVSAWNYIKNGQLEEAKNAINQAIQDSKTGTQPKTWFYRGNIYLAIYDDTTFRKKNPGALKEAITSFQKAIELNPKYEFKDQIGNALQECALNSFNEGVVPYNTKDYQTAYDAFKQSADLYAYINKTFNQTILDTLATLYTAYAATKLKKYDEAQALYQDLLDKGVSKPEIYASMGEMYIAMNDTAKAIAALSKGASMYPENENLMIQELNLYLFTRQFDKALDKLKIAIQKEPKFTALYVQLANIYEMQKDTANARKTYEQAIAIEPNNFDATYRLGAFYYNQAVEINNQMNKLDLNAQKQYDALKVQRDILFKKSLPYLEKAHNLDAKDRDTMIALKELYARLNYTDKLEAVKKELEALK